MTSQARRALALLSAAVLALAVVAGCGSGSGQPQTAARTPGEAGSRPSIVATTTIIADIARNVGGDHVAVRSLLPPGADPHTFVPTPPDMQLVADSALILYNGAGLEEWLDKLVQNAGGKRAAVVVSKGISARKTDEMGGQTADAEPDPHFWFDVKNAMVFTQNIRDALVELDPPSAEIYRANAGAYLARLADLDRWVEDQVKQVPAERRKLITNHDQFGYFADRYGFQIVATVQGATPGREPSAQEIARLSETIKTANVPAIFTENTANSNLAAQVAADNGVKVVSELYTDSLGPARSGADTYVGLMRTDVQTIVNALR